jgi:hypothetical protein
MTDEHPMLPNWRVVVVDELPMGDILHPVAFRLLPPNFVEEDALSLPLVGSMGSLEHIPIWVD